MERMKKRKKSLQRKLTKKLEQSRPKRYKKIKNEWNNLKHKLVRRLDARKLKWNEKINNILSSEKHKELFWKVVNNPIRRPTQTIPPLKDQRGVVHEDIETKLQHIYVTPTAKTGYRNGKG